VSDQAVTVKTNSSGSPTNTFVLAAGVPLQFFVTADPAWRDSNGTIVADITALYVTNAGGTAANFQIRSLYNS
jgi:hypothetical protein